MFSCAIVSLTPPRPISRAYVYSLVERIALLEGLLAENGLAVSPASYPPETRHRSLRSKEASSVDHTPVSSSTPQGSTTSEICTASSPYSSDDQSRDEHAVTSPRNRSSMHLGADVVNDLNTKRTRHDSLVKPADIKIESPMKTAISTVMHLSGTGHFDQSTMPAPPNPTPLWAAAHDHTSRHMSVHSTMQTKRIDSCIYGAWGDRAFELESYDPYFLDTQHGDPVPTEHHYASGNSILGGTTNLDFMPLPTSS